MMRCAVCAPILRPKHTTKNHQLAYIRTEKWFRKYILTTDGSAHTKKYTRYLAAKHTRGSSHQIDSNQYYSIRQFVDLRQYGTHTTTAKNERKSQLTCLLLYAIILHNLMWLFRFNEAKRDLSIETVIQAAYVSTELSERWKNWISVILRSNRYSALFFSPCSQVEGIFFIILPRFPGAKRYFLQYFRH